ncbi:MAG: penicillin-binding protein 2 [Candidatus Improbicoccus devescovinae]|nr:MAG: penicillin-binding protein 2 [Candidatus Improbicoccus devescovinae]
MINKILKLFILFMCSIILMLFNIKKIATNENFYETALKQSSYKLRISNSRGLIYDCNNIPLVDNETKKIAVINPNNPTELSGILNFIDYDKEKISKKLKDGFPFLVKLNKNYKNINKNNNNIFDIPVRTNKNISSIHLVGYVDSENNGISGIEKIYNNYLNNESEIEIIYYTNAFGNIISGGKSCIIDKSYSVNKGVKLYIDKNLQEITENISEKYINRGSVIITKVPDCEIKSCISLPNFSPENMAYHLNDPESPFLNRALNSYDVGSVFKLVTSIAGLESGLDENEIYDCTGICILNCGSKIDCYNRKSHGKIDLNHAIACSCNGYFAELSKKIDPNFFLEIARNLGFSQSIQIAPNLNSDAGILPDINELHDEKKAAIFSFGQGKLLATPLHIAALTNTIASNGMYSEPKLVMGIINENMEFEAENLYKTPKKCFKKFTSDLLKKFMKSSITIGTSATGRPKTCTAAAKTSTAETGIFKNNKRVTQSWFTGFFPFDNPKYCITIIAEDCENGHTTCAPIFKELADEITKRNL